MTTACKGTESPRGRTQTKAARASRGRPCLSPLRGELSFLSPARRSPPSPLATSGHSLASLRLGPRKNVKTPGHRYAAPSRPRPLNRRTGARQTKSPTRKMSKLQARGNTLGIAIRVHSRFLSCVKQCVLQQAPGGVMLRTTEMGPSAFARKKTLLCIDRGGFGSVRAWHNRNCFLQMALAFLRSPTQGRPVR
jgi:hypothetical protein